MYIYVYIYIYIYKTLMWPPSPLFPPRLLCGQLNPSHPQGILRAVSPAPPQAPLWAAPLLVKALGLIHLLSAKSATMNSERRLSKTTYTQSGTQRLSNSTLTLVMKSARRCTLRQKITGIGQYSVYCLVGETTP